MNFNLELTELLKQISSEGEKLIPSDKIISLLDFTLLNEQADEMALSGFSSTLASHSVAAVCLFPQHLMKIKVAPAVKRATVVNFPEGNDSWQTVSTSITHAIHEARADEIDYVFPYQPFLNGQQAEALSACQKALQLCIQQGVTFKVILETGAFSCAETLYQLATAVANQGCHFLKTSTGKINIGATPLSAFILLKAIRSSANKTCGLKISGGIRTVEQATGYIKLAELYTGLSVHKDQFRIGASLMLTEESL